MDYKNKYTVICCLFILLGGLTGCVSGAQSPDFLFLNSYFPSWLIGSLVALVLTIFVRFVLIKFAVDDFLPFRFFVYVGIWLTIAMAFAYIYSPR